MIELNEEYEKLFDPDNIDEEFTKIGHEVDVVGIQIKEILKIVRGVNEWECRLV